MRPAVIARCSVALLILFSLLAAERAAALGFVEEALLQKTLDEERKLAGISKTMSASEIVDYRFLREALAGMKGRR